MINHTPLNQFHTSNVRPSHPLQRVLTLKNLCKLFSGKWRKLIKQVRSISNKEAHDEEPFLLSDSDIYDKMLNIISEIKKTNQTNTQFSAEIDAKMEGSSC
jgi:uncharacterized protein (UPF0305 family)